MAKETSSREIKNILVSAQSNLKKIMAETSRLAKRGERDLVNLSKIGKFEFDLLNLHLRRENLCRELGEKIADFELDKKIEDIQVNNLSGEIREVNSKIKDIKLEIDKLTKVIFKNK